jgi:hypothetical protein
MGEWGKQVVYINLNEGLPITSDQRVWYRVGDLNLQTVEFHIRDIDGETPVNLMNAKEVWFEAKFISNDTESSEAYPFNKTYQAQGIITDPVNGIVEVTFDSSIPRDKNLPCKKAEYAYLEITTYDGGIRSTQGIQFTTLPSADISEEEWSFYLARFEELINYVNGLITGSVVPTLDEVIKASNQPDDPDTGFVTPPNRIRIGSEFDNATFERKGFTVLEEYDYDRQTDVTAGRVAVEGTYDYFEYGMDEHGHVFVEMTQAFVDEFNKYFDGDGGMTVDNLYKLTENSDSVHRYINLETGKLRFEANPDVVVTTEELIKHFEDSETIGFVIDEETNKIKANITVVDGGDSVE